MTNTFAARSLILLYVLAVLLSLAFAQSKLRVGAADVLSDYRYYLTFAQSGLATSAPTPNPSRGTSVLYTGVDGAAGIHKGIHFEPIKYVTPIIYAIVPVPFLLFAWYALLFFTPLLYGAYLLRKGTGGSGLWLATLAYGIAPAAYTVAVADLRPSSLLLAFFWLFAIAVYYERPQQEQIALLVALLLTREEALFFAGAVLLYEFIRKGVLARALLGTWFTGAAVCGAYLAWISDAYAIRSYGSLSTLTHVVLSHAVFFLGATIALLALLYFLIPRLRSLPRSWLASMSLFLLLVVPLALAPLLNIVSFGSLLTILGAMDGRYGMFFSVAVSLGLAWFVHDVRPRTIYATALLLTLCALAYQVYSPTSALTRYHAYAASKAIHAPILD